MATPIKSNSFHTNDYKPSYNFNQERSKSPNGYYQKQNRSNSNNFMANFNDNKEILFTNNSQQMFANAVNITNNGQKSIAESLNQYQQAATNAYLSCSSPSSSNQFNSNCTSPSLLIRQNKF